MRSSNVKHDRIQRCTPMMLDVTAISNLVIYHYVAYDKLYMAPQLYVDAMAQSSFH